MKHLDSVSLDSFIFSSMTRAVQYSEKYNDDAYEYRLPDPPDLGFFLECTFKPRNVFMVLTNPSIYFQARNSSCRYRQTLSEKSSSVRSRVASNWCSAVQGMGTLRTSQVRYLHLIQCSYVSDVMCSISFLTLLTGLSPIFCFSGVFSVLTR